MTEEEWRECDHPAPLLYLLHERAKVGGGTGLARKARLFVCGCVRQVLAPLTPRQRLAVEAAEAFADGLCSAEELRRAHTDRDQTFWATYPRDISCKTAVEAALYSGCFRPDQNRALCVQRVRCVFGDPFRPVRLSPAWKTPPVRSIAQAAYEERILPQGHLDPARLAVLADALEDAGCSDPDLLGHLGGPGPHVRGCWAVDLVLDKQ